MAPLSGGLGCRGSRPPPRPRSRLPASRSWTRLRAARLGCAASGSGLPAPASPAALAAGAAALALATACAAGEAERLVRLSVGASRLLLLALQRFSAEQFGAAMASLDSRSAQLAPPSPPQLPPPRPTGQEGKAQPPSPYAYRWPSAEEEAAPTPLVLAAATAPAQLQRLAQRCSAALRPLRISAGFSADAAAGSAALLLLRRFEDPGHETAEALLRLPLTGGPAGLELRARGALLRVGGDSPRVELPARSAGHGVTLTPAWLGGVGPALRAAWRSEAGGAAILPLALRTGRSAAWGELRPAALACAAVATHERRAAAGGSLPPGATHALRCTLRLALGGGLRECNGPVSAVATYKLRLPAGAVGAARLHPRLRRAAATLGLQLAPLGGGAAPALAFAKARLADGAALRVQVGLASSVLGAELGLPGAGGGERWAARLQWREGRLCTAALVRRVDV